MVRDSPWSLCCVLEQDTVSVLCSSSTQENRNCSDIIENCSLGCKEEGKTKTNQFDHSFFSI